MTLKPYAATYLTPEGWATLGSYPTQAHAIAALVTANHGTWRVVDDATGRNVASQVAADPR